VRSIQQSAVQWQLGQGHSPTHACTHTARTSSKIRMAGLFSTARAKATRCFSPPLSRTPRSPVCVRVCVCGCVRMCVCVCVYVCVCARTHSTQAEVWKGQSSQPSHKGHSSTVDGAVLVSALFKCMRDSFTQQSAPPCACGVCNPPCAQRAAFPLTHVRVSPS